MTCEDRSKYYAYLIVYGDDVLSIDVDPKKSIDKLGVIFSMREGSTEEPETYLEANTRK